MTDEHIVQVLHRIVAIDREARCEAITTTRASPWPS